MIKGRSCLEKASKNGFLEIVALLLKIDNVKVDEFNSFHPALYSACKNGHLEVVKVLLNDKRTDIWQHRSSRCLNRAVKLGHVEMVGLLLQKAYPSTDLMEPLYIAVEKGDLEITKLILEHKRKTRGIYGRETLVIQKKKVNENIMKLILLYEDVVNTNFL